MAVKKSQAKDAIGRCGDEVDEIVDALPKVPLGVDETDENRIRRVEAYALGTACTLAGREMSSMPFGGGRIGSRIDEAVLLEPKNPRVLSRSMRGPLLPAWVPTQSAAVQKLRAVTVMFEEVPARPRRRRAPQAYAFLGCIARSTWSGAREQSRALLIAPDYAYARRSPRTR
jgi:hypothetical protein